MNYFTTKETANYLGYNDDAYVRKLILSKKLEAKKVGTQWMVSDETINKFKVNANIQSKYKILLSMNQELRDLSDKITDVGPSASTQLDWLMVFSLGKGYKTQSAILSLCKMGYGEDAFVLTRTLFESMISLYYISADETNERAERFFAYDAVLRHEMLKNQIDKAGTLDKLIEKSRDPRLSTAVVQKISDEESEVQSKYKYKKGWSDKSLRDMADAVHRLDAYNTVYKLQCQIAHNATRSMNEYAKETPEGIVLEIGPSENLVEETLVIVFDCFYHIVKAYNEHYIVGFNTALEELSIRYSSTVKSMK